MSSSNSIKYKYGDIVKYENSLYKIISYGDYGGKYILAEKLNGEGFGTPWLILRGKISKKLESIEEIVSELI